MKWCRDITVAKQASIDAQIESARSFEEFTEHKKLINQRSDLKTLDIAQELAKSFDRLASKAALSVYTSPFNPFIQSFLDSLPDVSTECYECDGKGWDYGHRDDEDGEWKEPLLSLEESGKWFWLSLKCPENEMRIHWCHVCFECDGTGVESENI